MKKSNALMLSYIIFLVSTLIARAFFNWDGIDRIAMATTVAGCFFAISDYCGWLASFEKSCYEKFQELSNTLLEFTKIKADTIETQNTQLSHAIETFLPYKEENQDIDSWITDATQMLEKNNQRKACVEKTVKTCDTINPKINEGLKRSEKIYKVETMFAVLGFIVFFMIIAFDYFVLLITPFQSWITIIAFAIIMFTYFRKDVHEEKANRDLADLKEKAEKMKQDAIDVNEETKLINIEDELEKFREIKKQKPQLKRGDTNNG